MSKEDNAPLGQSRCWPGDSACDWLVQRGPERIREETRQRTGESPSRGAHAISEGPWAVPSEYLVVVGGKLVEQPVWIIL